MNGHECTIVLLAEGRYYDDGGLDINLHQQLN